MKQLRLDVFRSFARGIAGLLKDHDVAKVFPDFGILFQIDQHGDWFTLFIVKIFDAFHDEPLITNTETRNPTGTGWPLWRLAIYLGDSDFLRFLADCVFRGLATSIFPQVGILRDVDYHELRFAFLVKIELNAPLRHES